MKIVIILFTIAIITFLLGIIGFIIAIVHANMYMSEQWGNIFKGNGRA